MIKQGIFFLLIGLMVGCAGGGGSSTPTPPVIPPVIPPMCPPGTVNQGGQCVTPPPPVPPRMCTGGKVDTGTACECPQGMVDQGGQCVVQVVSCPIGQRVFNNQCLSSFQIIRLQLQAKNRYAPCGVVDPEEKALVNGVRQFLVNFGRCARSKVPGLLQLADVTATRMATDRTAGKAIPKTHIHVDNFTGAGNVRTGLTHGQRSQRVIQLLGGNDFLTQEDVMTSATGSLTRGPQGIIRSYLSERVVISSGYSGTLICSPGFNSSLCPGDFRNAQALVVLAAGNKPPGGSGTLIDRQQQTNTEAEARALVQANAPFLVVPGWDFVDLNGHPIVDGNGRHITFNDDNTVTVDSSLAPNLPVELATNSVPCGQTVMNHCVTAPWRTIYAGTDPFNDPTSIIFTGFVGTSNSHLYVATAMAQARYLWPNLTNIQLLEIVRKTALDIGAPGVDPVYGLGLFSVQDFFAPNGDLVDPLSLLPVRQGKLYLPIGGITVKGIDSYQRDFQVQVGTSPFIPYLGKAKETNGFYPLVFDDNSTAKGFMYQGNNFYSSVRIEEEGFLGGFGTGSYQLGDTTWMTFGTRKTLGSLNLNISLTHGIMEPKGNSLVKELQATYGTFSMSYDYTKTNTSFSYDLTYRTPIHVRLYLQGLTQRKVQSGVETTATFSFRF